MKSHLDEFSGASRATLYVSPSTPSSNIEYQPLLPRTVQAARGEGVSLYIVHAYVPAGGI